jgi:hypothetical protein
VGLRVNDKDPAVWKSHQRQIGAEPGYHENLLDHKSVHTHGDAIHRPIWLGVEGYWRIRDIQVCIIKGKDVLECPVY